MKRETKHIMFMVGFGVSFIMAITKQNWMEASLWLLLMIGQFIQNKQEILLGYQAETIKILKERLCK